MQTKALAEYAVGLTFEDLPADVRNLARDCVQDTIGIGIFGAQMPWSRIITDYVTRSAGAGPCSVFGMPGGGISAPFAALANGALAHAFEMDSLRTHSAGVHPAGTAAAVLAAAEETGASGKDLITAFVAGMEVMTRIGLATRHTPEDKGFHAPGLTGVFGAAVAAGRLYGLDAKAMTHALGIGGSLCSGLLEFAKSGRGGMVKRLHLGRSAEGGILAASLARGGFDGPDTVLEGAFGFMAAFTDKPAMEKLTEGLGDTWETRTICFKRCSCHITAHAPIEALQELRAEHGFSADDVKSLTIGTSQKVLDNHDIRVPQDVMAAQYSVPFPVALSMFHDPADPHSFLNADIADPAILDFITRMRLELFEETKKPGQGRVCKLDVELADGRTVGKIMTDSTGTATRPMSADAFDGKFRNSTRGMGEAKSEALLARIKDLENAPTVAGLLG